MEQAEIALLQEEVPIGCAVYYKGKCIDKAHNLTNKNKDPLAHAEILCLKRVPKKILSEIELFITCEPCIMCLSVIIKLGIPKIAYSCANTRFGGISTLNVSKCFNSTTTKIEQKYHPRTMEILQAFYQLENSRAPVEKRKVKHPENKKF
ncbi:tRNA-specific adenosine deaminase 2 [Nematocida sp. AWRm80]|nr:tRNA-specific adenosine deaminase 2 [Nematocida sp. AWRm80]